jgi:hypothetical protein
MVSSQDEAIAILRKWKAERAVVVIFVSNGPPDDPDTFFFSLTGTVKQASTSWLRISKGTNVFRLRLDLPGTSFHYVESRDPALQLGERDREDAELLFEGCLSMNLADGTFCAFNALRERAEEDEGED